ncbi:MAG: S-layer homology domain-containing protein [Oscillospiraceae bacterium]|nr:S-layer homology domain-containing protein [Oscillospiraceae bacterium]
MRKLALPCSILIFACMATCGVRPAARTAAADTGSELVASAPAPALAPAPETSGALSSALSEPETAPVAAAAFVPEAAPAAGVSGFADVSESDYYAAAVRWAKEEGLINGVTETRFAPEKPLTRGQAAVLIWRLNGQPEPVTGALPFTDAEDLAGYAAAVSWGVERHVFSGTGEGAFSPDEPCSCAQLLTFLWRSQGYTTSEEPWYGAACAWAMRRGIVQDLSALDLSAPCTRGDAAYFFFRYSQLDRSYDFAQPAPETASVSPDWFDGAVFIGDSVTVRLEMYCAATGALSRASFLAETSRCAGTAEVADDVAKCGAKNVYIMLGINDLAYDFEKTVSGIPKLVGRIREKVPDAVFLIQSVTPMTETSARADEKLNNDVIRAYNRRLLELCTENGWYYLDVACHFQDGNGYLLPEYCGDAREMGIHFSTAGTRHWVDYLLTHVPEPLK